MDRDFDLSLLRTFLTIATTGSFTAASHRLFRTQPAISLRLKRLEDMVGFPLINRSTEKTSLTAEGDLLFSYAKRMLALNDELVGRIRKAGTSEVIRIGLPEEYPNVDLEGVLAAFAADCPHVSFTIEVRQSAELNDALRDGRLDLIVNACLATNSESATTRRSPLIWVAGAQMVLSRYSQIPLVLPAEGNLYRQVAIQALVKAESPWRVVCTTANWPTTKSAILAGLGISAVSRDMICPGLRPIGEDAGLPTLPDRGLTLLSRPQPTSDALWHLSNLLGESLLIDGKKSSSDARTDIGSVQVP